jgi:hypothetical protein
MAISLDIFSFIMFSVPLCACCMSHLCIFHDSCNILAAVRENRITTDQITLLHRLFPAVCRRANQNQDTIHEVNLLNITPH